MQARPSYFLPSIGVAFAIAFCFCGGCTVFAQQTAPTNVSNAPKTMKESAAARRKALENAEAQRQKRSEAWDQRTQETIEARDRKRNECRKQAREQNLHWMKRVRFVRKCMTLP
jgi:hypothetical protein